MKKKLRPARQVAQRAIVLNCLVATTFKAPKADLVAWLESEGLWEEVSPWEVAYLKKASHTDSARIEANHRAEACATLLWALRKLDRLSVPSEPTDLMEIVAAQPKLFTPTADFVATAKLRPAIEIYDFNQAFYEAHWAIRDAYLRKKKIPDNYHPVVVRERHYASNWLCVDLTEEPEEWDDVNTDT